MKSLRNLIAAAAVVVVAAAPVLANAADSIILPTPENNIYAYYGTYTDATGGTRDAIMMNGIPIAFKYDDFWSYSAKLLLEIQTTSPTLISTDTYGSYKFSTGTGTIDINLTSTAIGATNEVSLPPPGPSGNLFFQDPAELDNGNTVWGWNCNWGGATQTCTFYDDSGETLSTYTRPAVGANDVGGVTTVGNLLAYLQSIDPTYSIPLIYADYNQTGSGDSLWFSALVEIIDPATGLPVASWALDGTNNGLWDPTDPTYNYGLISFLATEAECLANPWDPVTGTGCAGVTADGSVYDKLEHNKGSGAADFIVFADTMDLSLYNPDFLWVMTGNLGCIPNITGPYIGSTSAGCNTNGAEEFGILGGVAPSRVPEPGSLLLLSLGLLAAGYTTRRKSRK